MAFHSAHFLLFFPIVLAVYWSLRRNAALRVGFLLAASYYFYMSWNAAFAGLIFASTLLDYVAGSRIAAASNPRVKRLWLAISLTGNLGTLFVFKYYNFFLESFASGASAMGWSLSPTQHSLLLPVGISFYTFQTLSYTTDVYRGELAPARSFWRFALFVAFFPQLVAGPIVRASTFLPQMDAAPRFDDRAAERGLGQILAGIFKKVCIADLLGVTLVDPVFSDPSGYGSWTVWMAMYAYAFQIYYDFSGYSDVAIGAARMLGFELPINFNRPYLATSLRDFWRRWHISLSTWLRDYLYVPLGGGRGSAWRTARNLAIVMLLGGLWHGAAWGFVLWGAAHGLMLGAGRLFHSASGIDADRCDQPLVSRVARIVVTFHLAAGCFVMFRAVNWEATTQYFAALVRLAPGARDVSPLAFAALAAAMLLEWTPRVWAQRVAEVFERISAAAQGGLIAASILLFSILSDSGVPFIYFQF